MSLTLGGSAALLAACGGPSTVSAATPSAAAPTFAKAEIDGDLEWLNWSQYMSPDVISAFEQHYSVKVNQHNFDNMQDMLAKLGSGTSYDLTFPTMNYVYQLLVGGGLLPIDHTQLTNWKEVPAYFNNPWYDKNGLHSVPYAFWTSGIAYRTDQIDPSVITGSWNDIWSIAQKYPGKAFLLDDYQETLGMSLLRKHYDLNSNKRAQLDQAASELIKIKRDLGGFSNDDIGNLTNGTAAAHHAWSGDFYQAIIQVSNPEVFKYETCKEGVPAGNDAMVIPKRAKHPGTALKFIDWMLDPANATSNVKYFGYPQVTLTGIKAYQQNIASEYPSLTLSLDEVLEGPREVVPTGADLQLWNEEWRRVKSG